MDATKTPPRQIRVDYNDIDEAGRARTSLKFAEPGVVPSIGQRLLAGDDDGNCCIGEVVEITPTGEVALALDLTTFKVFDDRPGHPVVRSRAVKLVLSLPIISAVLIAALLVVVFIVVNGISFPEPP